MFISIIISICVAIMMSVSEFFESFTNADWITTLINSGGMIAILGVFLKGLSSKVKDSATYSSFVKALNSVDTVISQLKDTMATLKTEIETMKNELTNVQNVYIELMKITQNNATSDIAKLIEEQKAKTETAKKVLEDI